MGFGSSKLIPRAPPWLTPQRKVLCIPGSRAIRLLSVVHTFCPERVAVSPKEFAFLSACRRQRPLHRCNFATARVLHNDARCARQTQRTLLPNSNLYRFQELS